jgi:lipopolysaccharide transport system ATP-binding protein
MTDPIITVENLGKSYRIGRKQQKPQTIRAAMKQLVGAPFSYMAERFRNPEEAEILWALRGVSFEVNRGEVLGIIGRNGAGKSTLLKILSRITDPTEGRARIRGSVNSLLEVGTGFHPELTGRENIFMNSAIHGLRHDDIVKKLDGIVEFAEIEKFIDTPVKRYSSGMYMRLAFAVAAHLGPDVLIVDEVLAVGDASFQKKCLGRMGEVVKEGRTVIFVSHNIPALVALCPRSLLLESGRLVMNDVTTEVLAHYMSHQTAGSGADLTSRMDRGGSGAARLISMHVKESDGKGGVSCRSKLRIELEYESRSVLRNPKVLISMRDQLNQAIYFLDSTVAGWSPDEIPPKGRICCETGSLNLTPGPIYLNIALCSSDTILDHLVDAVRVDVAPDDFFGSGRIIDRGMALGLIDQKWGQL